MLVAVVVGMLTRVAQVATELCWSVAPPAVLLMISYGAGLALWERMSLRGRHLWLGLLLVLWCWISWFLPANLAFGYAWLAVPLAILALRMFTDAAAVVVVGLITALLVVCLVRATEGFRLDLWAPPVAVVWAAVALYRGQQRLCTSSARPAMSWPGSSERPGGSPNAPASPGSARLSRPGTRGQPDAAAGRRTRLGPAAGSSQSQVHTVTEALGASLADTRSIIRDLTPPHSNATPDCGAARAVRPQGCGRRRAAGLFPDLRQTTRRAPGRGRGVAAGGPRPAGERVRARRRRPGVDHTALPGR